MDEQLSAPLLLSINFLLQLADVCEEYQDNCGYFPRRDRLFSEFLGCLKW